jgi:predicted CopG family antitoxin
MKKKITLTIDSDVYDQLNDLPRKVSISEFINWTLKAMLQDIKEGKFHSGKEAREFIKQTPEGKDFLERSDEYLGPKLDKIIDEIENIKKTVGLNKKKG